MSDMWEYEDEDAPEERTQPLRRKRRSAGEEARGNLYLLTGLLLGLAIGLFIAWVISPVTYMDTDPGTLGKAYKDDYRQVIALAYSANGNLERARERMKLVDAGDSIPQLASQAQRMLAENQPPIAARALAVLAADLGQPPSARTAQPAAAVSALTVEVVPPTEQNAAPMTTQEVSAAIQTPTIPIPTRTQTPTLTPLPSFTPRPTATPLLVLDTAFTLKEKLQVCDGSVPAGLLQVFVSDAEENPMPGVRITVDWEEGQEVFYTGLVPEIGLGYADFLMSPSTLYNLRIGDISDVIENISIGSCEGGWELTFVEKR
jgi:hypothetical protein